MDAAVEAGAEAGKGSPQVHRHPSLDWLRVLAFGLLIPFHAGLGFLPTNPYGFSNNHHGGHGLVVTLLWVHQWRLPILFLVAGMGTALAFSTRKGRQFLRERGRRILIPLVAATLLILPLHTYWLGMRLGHPLVHSDGLIGFLPRWWWQSLVLVQGSWHDPLPLWRHVQHLWFLLNVFLYSLLFLTFANAYGPAQRLRWLGKLQRLLRSPYAAGLLALALPLFLAELLFKPAWRGEVGTGYEFVWYLLFFLYGALFIQCGDPFWKHVPNARWVALLVGAAAMAGFTATLVLADAHEPGYGTRVQEGGWVHRGDPWLDAYSVAGMAFHSLNAMAWVVAFVAWVSHLLRHGSRILAYLTAAHYTAYIVHMSLVLVGLYIVRDWNLWWPLEFLLVTLATAMGVIAFYEVARRYRLTRTLFAARRPPREWLDAKRKNSSNASELDVPPP